MAVVAEAVEACLPSPWKPWLRALGGASRGRSATGRVHSQGLCAAASGAAALGPRPHTRSCSPEPAPPPAFPAGATPARWPHGTPPFPRGRNAVVLPRRNRKYAASRGAGPPRRASGNRDHLVAIVSRPKRSRGLVSRTGRGLRRGRGEEGVLGQRELGASAPSAESLKVLTGAPSEPQGPLSWKQRERREPFPAEEDTENTDGGCSGGRIKGGLIDRL